VKIVKLDGDLTLTYSWSNNNHGICGHTFEVIEYYFILKDFFDTNILLCEDITPEIFKSAIEDKYDFTKEEIADILNNTKFINRPILLKGKNILFVDGGIINTNNYTLLFDNIFYFACGNKEVKHNNKNNVYILQDDRVYEPVVKNGINYKKKLLFDRMKPIKNNKTANLIYVTKNCRDINDEVFKELEKTYDGNFLYLGNEEKYTSNRFKFMKMPVRNLFSEFDTYIYTEVPRHFDCSPRFIAECKYYDKKVIYHNIYYLEEDLGLKWRKYDIENDFNSLFLTKDDDLIPIIKSII